MLHIEEILHKQSMCFRKAAYKNEIIVDFLRYNNLTLNSGHKAMNTFPKF